MGGGGDDAADRARPRRSRRDGFVLLGVLGGLAAFGPIGLFVGPITVTLLLALWREWAEVEP